VLGLLLCSVDTDQRIVSWGVGGSGFRKSTAESSGLCKRESAFEREAGNLCPVASKITKLHAVSEVEVQTARATGDLNPKHVRSGLSLSFILHLPRYNSMGNRSVIMYPSSNSTMRLTSNSTRKDPTASVGQVKIRGKIM